MTESVESLIKDLELGLEGRFKQIPEFDFITVDSINPQQVMSKIVDCSRSIDSVSELQAEIPVVRSEARFLERGAVIESQAFDPNCFEDFNLYLKDLKESLDYKRVLLSTHLQTLRGLMSALSKNPSLADLVIDQDEISSIKE